MGFPKKIRDAALVDAARHCCVCHRYCGVAVEVHHIIPESEGGSNAPGNAIALCLDCHAAAGHYNPRHPKGTKYSPSELRRHRDEWHAWINEHGAPVVDHKDIFHIRHVLCRDEGIIQELIQGTLDKLPVENPHLVPTPILHFIANLFSANGAQTQNPIYSFREYESLESYHQVHGEDRTLKTTPDDALPYFQGSRIPTSEELISRLENRDSVIHSFLNQRLAPENFCRAVLAENGCGGSPITEEDLIRRPIWLVFLAATNLSQSPVSISEIAMIKESADGLEYRPYSWREGGDPVAETLPAAQIPSGATVLVPILTLLAPLKSPNFTEYFNFSKEIARHSWSELTFAEIDSELGHFHTIGPAWYPQHIRLSSSDPSRRQPVHPLDPKNVYILNRRFAMGSCPYLLLRRAASKEFEFWIHLFSNHPEQTVSIDLVIPADVDQIIIAELEEEQTTISGIWRNGTLIMKSVRLEKNEELPFEVAPGDMVRIQGSYRPFITDIKESGNPLVKNERLTRFLSGKSTTAHS